MKFHPVFVTSFIIVIKHFMHSFEIPQNNSIISLRKMDDSSFIKGRLGNMERTRFGTDRH